MRLYPAAPGLSTRVALADDELGDKTIAKGTNIVLLPWVLHRHRRLWEDPERFDPDRFLPERSQGRPRFAFLPFGAGPRVCIGQILAVNEAVLLLASLAQHFRPKMAPGARVELLHNVTLQPRRGLAMILEPR
jgi:cytochrome P450